MNIIQLSGIISSMSYCSDGGMRVGLHTNEMTNDEKNELQKYFQQFGYILFKPTEFQNSDIPKESIEDKTKSPSKRLRAVLYIWYQQSGSKNDFEILYRQKIEDMINIVKSKLDK